MARAIVSESAISRKKEYKCEQCEVIFWKYANKPNRFCGRKCFDEFVSINSNLVKRHCSYCGKISNKSPEPNKVYCNRQCLDAAVDIGASVCIVCKMEFNGLVLRDGKYVRVRRATCGDKCLHAYRNREDKARDEALRLASTGSNNVNWTGGTKKKGYRGANWSEIRKRIIKRDKYTCQDCGVSEVDSGRSLEVHHKTPFHQFAGDNEKANKPSNLISLCGGCHHKADWEWRRLNDVQLVLPLDGGKMKPALGLPRAPQDLTGLVINNCRIIRKIPQVNKNSTKWLYECLICGSIKERWRATMIRAKAAGCGCQGWDRTKRRAANRAAQ